MPGSFAAPMNPRIEDAASSAPIRRNCFLGVSSIGCVTIPALSSTGKLCGNNSDQPYNAAVDMSNHSQAPRQCVVTYL